MMMVGVGVGAIITIQNLSLIPWKNGRLMSMKVKGKEKDVIKRRKRRNCERIRTTKNSGQVVLDAPVVPAAVVWVKNIIMRPGQKRSLEMRKKWENSGL